ncbi:hypothetical protein ABPG72_004473 [Tetrahymena utriculariae]
MFQKLMKNSIFSISTNDSKMIIQFELEQLTGKIQFNIQLVQYEFNTNDAILKIREKIWNHEANLRNSQKQLEQIIKDQSGQTEQIKDLANKIEEMKEVLIKHIESLNLDHQNQIQQLKKEINSLRQSYKYNVIQFQEELEMIKKWISGNQINLKLIYKVTIH